MKIGFPVPELPCGLARVRRAGTMIPETLVPL